MVFPNLDFGKISEIDCCADVFGNYNCVTCGIGKINVVISTTSFCSEPKSRV